MAHRSYLGVLHSPALTRAMGGGEGVPLTSYPALLWLATLSALLGSFQNGEHMRCNHQDLKLITYIVADLPSDFELEVALN